MSEVAIDSSIEKYKVLVCGGRNFKNYDLVFKALLNIFNQTKSLRKEMIVCQGGAKGADYFARQFCKSKGVECITYEANWSLHGKAAGPIRNELMATEFKPDIALVFPGGRGTQDMISRLKKYNIKIEYHG